ncbi:hypothetical protein NYE70_17895 [Paenibacillus sp. FSL R5-0407]|uniref:hypothetical protein n=1 Tax=Paenibacillus sp. FSL R5-0407 TaxID=2975320 RepID=UPI0030F85C61
MALWDSGTADFMLLNFKRRPGLVVCRLAGMVGGRESGVILKMRVCDKWDGYVCFCLGLLVLVIGVSGSSARA